jgi:hypothetical protein
MSQLAAGYRLALDGAAVAVPAIPGEVPRRGAQPLRQVA